MRTYPSHWVFVKDKDLKEGDRLMVEVSYPKAQELFKCWNCYDLGSVYSRVVTRKSQKVTYIKELDLMVNVEMEAHPCPVCAGEQVMEWLEDNSGLKDLVLDGKKATTILLDPYPKTGQEEAHALIQQMLPLLPKSGLWVLLAGDHGRGKTHLAFSLVNECRKNRVWAHYTSSEAILTRFKETFSDKSNERTAQVQNYYSTLPVLIVDELDRVKWTDWAAEKTFAILNERYTRGRSTWLISNKGPSQLTEESPTLKAIMSRVSAGKLIHVKGRDLRPGQQSNLLREQDESELD